jgi:group I intron endonuclease
MSGRDVFFKPRCRAWRERILSPGECERVERRRSVAEEEIELTISKAELRLVSGIYVIRCLVDSKVYVGSTLHLVERLRCHLSALRKNKHLNKPLQIAWNAYGEEAFDVDILEICESEAELLHRREQFYLDVFELKYNVYCYAGVYSPKRPKLLVHSSRRYYHKISDITRTTKSIW